MVRLGTNSDTITLEYDDRVRLMFTPDSSALLDGVGEYIRDSTTVNIIENDCTCFSFITYIYKWKNHFYKMKGDVGMSGHEKERKQEDAYTKIQTHS